MFARIKQDSFIQFCVWSIAAVALSVVGLRPWLLLENSYLSIFQWRDLERASELLHGHWIFYGPELTGGGHLPGSFFYGLLSVPLMFTGGWEGAWWWMLILTVFSIVAGFVFLQRRFSVATGFFWIGLFLLAMNVHFFLVQFINPSFLFLFVTLSSIDIVIAFSEGDSRTRGRAFVMACVTIALGAQIHYSAAALLGALLTLQLTSKDRLPRRSVLIGYGAMALLTLPYLMWSLFAPSQVSSAGRFQDAPPALFAMLSQTFGASAKHFLISFADMNYRVTPLVVPLLLFCAWCVRDQKIKWPSEIKPLVICTAWTFLPFSLCYFLPGARRYGIPFLVDLLLLSAILFFCSVQTKKRLRVYAVLSLIGLIAVWLDVFLFRNRAPGWDIYKFSLCLGLAAVAWFFEYRSRRSDRLLLTFVFLTSLFLILSQPAVLRHESREQAMLTVHQWREIWGYIYPRLPLPYEQMRERLYFVRGHSLEDAGMSFETMTKSLEKKPLKNPPDGYIVAPGVSRKRILDVRDWLLRQPIAQDVKSALRADELTLDEPYFHSRVMIVGYRVQKQNFLPRHFHDLAWGYRPVTWPEPGGESSALQTGENDFTFSWNECEKQNIECVSGMTVHIDPQSQIARVRIFGLTLSQLTNWVTPRWTQVWRQPYFEAVCGGRTQHVVLADSIGLDARYWTTPRRREVYSRNSSLVAPMEKEIHLDCRRPSEIRVGRSSGSAFQLTRKIELPAVELSLGWPR